MGEETSPSQAEIINAIQVLLIRAATLESCAAQVEDGYPVRAAEWLSEAAQLRKSVAQLLRAEGK